MIKTNICCVPDCGKERDFKQKSRFCVMHRVRWGRHKSYELPEKPKLPEGIVYICQKHGELKINQAYCNPKDNYYSCIKCRRASDKEFYKNNPGKQNEYKKFYYLNSNNNNHGEYDKKIKISKKDYDDLYEFQNGKCAICNKHEESKNTNPAGKSRKTTKRLAIDHDHITLKIRGLLCHHCNTGLGHYNDSIDLLQSAIDYLKKHQ